MRIFAPSSGDLPVEVFFLVFLWRGVLASLTARIARPYWCFPLGTSEGTGNVCILLAVISVDASCSLRMSFLVIYFLFNLRGDINVNLRRTGFSRLFEKDIEKEVRKEVDEAIAKAKVRKPLRKMHFIEQFSFFFMHLEIH